MSWLPIRSYALDFQPGTTGIVYFKCEGEETPRKTPQLQPDVFNAVCNVLSIGTAQFETDQKIFRNAAYQKADFAPRTIPFTETDWKNIEGFESWSLPK